MCWKITVHFWNYYHISQGPMSLNSSLDWDGTVDRFHKSHNTPVPYPTMYHSEQKCAHSCFEWCIVGYGTGTLWKYWIKLTEPTEPFSPKCSLFSRRHFEMHFPECKLLYLDEKFIEICSPVSNWQYPSTGSDDGLAPVRRQAIIWTSDSLI